MLPNYQQGKVYKMVMGDLIYIGSTCQKYLCQRLAQHTKSYNYWLDTQKKYVICRPMSCIKQANQS